MFMKLNDLDTVVTAYASRCRGPGWSNSPVWVVIQDSNGKLREECIQPEEHTAEMHAMYDICASANKALLNSVHKYIRSKNKKERGQ